MQAAQHSLNQQFQSYDRIMGGNAKTFMSFEDGQQALMKLEET